MTERVDIEALRDTLTRVQDADGLIAGGLLNTAKVMSTVPALLDELEALRAENVTMREGLEKIEVISTNHGGWYEQGAWEWGQMMGKTAREALSSPPKEAQ